MKKFSPTMFNPLDLQKAYCNILIQLDLDRNPSIPFVATFSVLLVAAHISHSSTSIKPNDTLQNAMAVSLFRRRNCSRYFRDQTFHGSP